MKKYVLAHRLLDEGVSMLETRVAKLFMNGASQAVRLPADFRFEGDIRHFERIEAPLTLDNGAV